ncbi:HAD family hydrolase [Selenomonas montiformis]|uniref:HAD family hydrolase n=1 Tax=Selenomonas montiformis TaxID=2652285 RepID=UPI003F8A99E0
MSKAVFFDIDGTLINIKNGQTSMHEAVRAAIRDLRRAGCYTFIASGRPWAYLSPDFTSSGLFDGFVLLNGAIVLLDGRVIFRRDLPLPTVKEIVAIAEANGIEYILESWPDVYLKTEYRGLEKVYRDIDIPVDRFVRDYELDRLSVGKMEFLCGTPGAGGIFHKFLAWPGLTGLIDPTLQRYMELYSAEVSKATGIQQALSYLNIPVEQSYAFGDGLNDLEMMDAVGHSLVMGNAGRELKARAEHVLPTVDEDGAAEGIYRYILKRQGFSCR